MPSSSDVFIISAIATADPAEALRQAIKNSGVSPGRVQDFICGTDDGLTPIGAEELARETAILCPYVTVSSSLRALFFASQSILCENADVVLLSGSQDGACAALLLASPSAVGVYNLSPLACIDVCSLAGADVVLKKAGLASENIGVSLDGTCGALLAAQLVMELQEREVQWGMVNVAGASILIERV